MFSALVFHAKGPARASNGEEERNAALQTLLPEGVREIVVAITLK